MKKTFSAGLTLTFLLFVMFGMANATLIGDEVSFTIANTHVDSSVTTNSGTVTVGAGVEVDPLMPYAPWVALDVGASSFNFIYDDEVDRAIRKFEFTLSDLDWTDPTTQVASATFAINDIDNAAASIYTTANSVSIVLNNTDGNYFVWEIGDQLAVNINTTTAPVPEPATFLLLGSGLAGLAFYRRKRK